MRNLIAVTCGRRISCPNWRAPQFATRGHIETTHIRVRRYVALAHGNEQSTAVAKGHAIERPLCLGWTNAESERAITLQVETDYPIRGLRLAQIGLRRRKSPDAPEHNAVDDAQRVARHAVSGDQLVLPAKRKRAIDGLTWLFE